MSKSKAKGTRAETGIVKRWIAAGIECRRVLLSGMFGHVLGEEYHGDVKAMINGHSITVQSKCLANGWAGLYRDLSNHDCLIIKANRKESLVILPESLFLSLVGGVSAEPIAQICDACGESYTGKHWCLVLSNNPELAERISASKATRDSS